MASARLCVYHVVTNSMWTACKLTMSSCLSLYLLCMLTFSRTPWLTMRRRTCPICKGDVVRSLAQSSSSSDGPDTTRYRDDPDSSDSDQSDESSSGQGSDAVAIHPTSDEGLPDDVERGEELPLLGQERRSARLRWTELLGVSLDTLRDYSGSLGRDSARRRAREERDR